MSENVKIQSMAPGRYDYKAEFAKILGVKNLDDIKEWKRAKEHFFPAYHEPRYTPKPHENPLIDVILKFWYAGHGLATLHWAEMFNEDQRGPLMKFVDCHCAPCINTKQEVLAYNHRLYPHIVTEDDLARKPPEPMWTPGFGAETPFTVDAP